MAPDAAVVAGSDGGGDQVTVVGLKVAPRSVVLMDLNGNVMGDAAFSTLRVNAGAVAPGQSLKVYAGTVSVATGATVALETVAAGKTFYVTDISIGGNTATQFLAQIQAAGITIANAYVKGDTAPWVEDGIESQPSASSGQAVTLVLGAAAATISSFNIRGFEQ